MDRRDRLKIFQSVLFWICAASAVGLAAGAAVSLFSLLLDVFPRTGDSLPLRYWLLPGALFLSRYLVMRFGGSGEAPGNDKFHRAISSAAQRKALGAVGVKAAAAVMTIIFGGSAGKAGPSAQIGSALAAEGAYRMHLSRGDRKLLIFCGIAAGFSAVFTVPIAAVLLTAEIFRYRWKKPGLLCLFISAWWASRTALLMQVSHHRVPLLIDGGMSLSLAVLAVLGGLFFAAAALLLMWTLKKAESLFCTLSLPLPLKAAVGGVLLLIIASAVSPVYLGLGNFEINLLLAGEQSSPLGFFYKILTTSLTLGSGGTGGIITPIFFTGASAGSLFARLTGADSALFAGAGMTAVLAAAANAPAAAVVLSAELFGPAVLPVTLPASVTSWLVTKNRRLYPGRLLLFSKNGSFGMSEGEDAEK